MSLAINIDRVKAVLLQDGKWYDVQFFKDGRSSFALDAYEYVEHHPTNADKDRMPLGGGTEPLIPATGATWEGDDKQTYCCPITSIVAVQLNPKQK